MSSEPDHAEDIANAAGADHGDSHGGHDDHPPAATDIFPESSPQDLVLKLVTVVTAFLISGSFIWWQLQPLSADLGEHGHGAGESAEH